MTLGSSPRPTLVYVPGVEPGQLGATQSIAPLGWVEERWISIGASILYLSQVGTTQLLLLGAVLLVCLSYLVVAFSALLAAERREFAILSALGWPPWHPARLLLTQALLLGLGGGIIGLLVAVLVTALLGSVLLWPVVIGTVPAMLVLALLAALYPLWQLWHLEPVELLRAGASNAATRGRSRRGFWSRVFPLVALAVRNLARARLRTVMVMVSLFFSAMLLVIMVSGTLTLQQTLQGTLLGQFVLLQTAAPQLAGCVFAVVLSFLNVADLLLLQVQERQQEIGLLQAVGWRAGMVQRLFVREGVILALMSTLPGVLVAQGILSLQHAAQSGLLVLLVNLGAVLLLSLTAILAALPALRAMGRMQVVDILRAG